MPDREIIKSKPVYRRRLLFASIFFAALVVTDLAIIGFLSYRVLSREVWQKARIESELVAERIAREVQEMVHHEDPGLETFKIRERQMEVNRYVNSILTNQGIIKQVEILDNQKNVVLQWTSGLPDFLKDQPRQGGGQDKAITVYRPIRHIEREFTMAPVTDPAQNIGAVRVVVPEGVLENQVATLRSDLTVQLVVGALVSLLLLGLTFLYVLQLIRKSRRLEAEAQIADRLAYIGSLASGLAHEIRNPLNAMNVNLQMLEEEIEGAPKPGGEEIRPLIDGTMGEIKRLNRLVSDFLDYARPSEPKLAPVDINGVVRETVEFLRADLEASGIRVSADFAPVIPPVVVDPQRIRQALMNLLLNAKQVLGPDGSIEVFSGVGPEGNVRISVRDNGPGIPIPEREKIFQIFYSTKGGGTGMGLPIAKRILESHGGSLEVESTPGKGTCFIMVLPRTRRSGESGREDSPGADLVRAAVIAKN